jgi:VanZ family protein
VLFWPDPVGGGSGLYGADKVVHAGLFALLAVTARLLVGRHRGLLLTLAGYAALSELVQASLLSSRSGDVLDLAADLVGVAVGWWLVGRAGRGRPRGSTAGVRLRS